jgi:putative ABC transport system permease protein
MTFALLIGSFVWSELQVNATLRNADNQYIIRSKWKQPGMGYEDVTLAPLGKTLVAEYPNLVANQYRFDVVTTAVSNGDKHFAREVAEAGDSTMISMYGFPMLYGDARTALKDPNSVVLTEENAMKYFGKTDVVGQVLSLSNYVGGKQNFTVTGVLKSLSKNSITYLWDTPVNVFIPLNSLQGRTDADSWTTYNLPTYIELKEGVTTGDLAKPIEQLIATYAPKEVDGNLQVFLTPLKGYYREFNKGVVKKTIYALSTIALLVMIMAMVNFINSSIGGSSSRIKEIGVRKVLGSRKSQIIGQFLAESIILALIAISSSFLFYELFRPLFIEISGRKIDPLWISSPYFVGFSILSTLLIGITSGLYPAFVLSSLPSVDSLKGKLKSVKEGLLFRRFLLAAQFSIALFVFCAAVTISQQVTYFFDKDLGYNKESVVLVSLPREWTPQGVAKMETIRNEFARMTEISDISISSSTVKGGTSYTLNLYRFGQDSTNAIPASVLQTDEHFPQTYQIPVVAGQFYQSSAGVHHEDKLVLNEAAIKALGYKSPAAAIGQQLLIQGYKPRITIIGVTKDFSFSSMREKIAPVAIGHVSGAGNLFSYFSIRLRPDKLTSSITSIETKFHQLLPDAPFEFTFIDEALRQTYQSELQLKKAAQTATVLALIIVLSGILGMVSLSVSRRTREVGIRKVLGANAQSIVLLFMNEFLLALLIAVLIAFPVAFLLMQAWLQNFAYHIDISLISFISVGLLFALVIALIVSLQTIKAAWMNPVKSLRSE